MSDNLYLKYIILNSSCQHCVVVGKLYEKFLHTYLFTTFMISHSQQETSYSSEKNESEMINYCYSLLTGYLVKANTGKAFRAFAYDNIERESRRVWKKFLVLDIFVGVLRVS